MMANGGLERLMANPALRGMAENMQNGGGMPDFNALAADPSIRDMYVHRPNVCRVIMLTTTQGEPVHGRPGRPGGSGPVERVRVLVAACCTSGWIVMVFMLQAWWCWNTIDTLDTVSARPARAVEFGPALAVIGTMTELVPYDFDFSFDHHPNYHVFCKAALIR